MKLHAVPVALAVSMFVGINVCFVVAVGLGHIDWCFPYVEGCVSISKAAREVPAQQIYRFTIMIGACLMLPYWFLSGCWLQQLTANESSGRLFVAIGMLSAVFLVFNVALFGDTQGMLNTLRRACVAGFFILMTVAQLMFTRQLSAAARQMASLELVQVVRSKIAICSAQLILAGLVVAAPLFESKSQINNAVEWNYVLLMLLFFMVTASAWKKTAYRFSGCSTVPAL